MKKELKKDMQPEIKAEHYTITPEDGIQEGRDLSGPYFVDSIGKRRYFKGFSSGIRGETSDSRIVKPAFILMISAIAIPFIAVWLYLLVRLLQGGEVSKGRFVVLTAAVAFIIWAFAVNLRAIRKNEKAQAEEAGVSVKEWRASGRGAWKNFGKTLKNGESGGETSGSKEGTEGTGR